MSTLALPRRFNSRPHGRADVDWARVDSLAFACLGAVPYTTSGLQVPFGLYEQSSSGAVVLNGGSTYFRVSTGVVSGAADAVTIEVICDLHSISSLANLFSLHSHVTGTNAVDIVGDSTQGIRGLFAYTGDPVEMLLWGNDNDVDTGLPFLAGQQHLTFVKSAGTGAVPLKLYKNGLLIASGDSWNHIPWNPAGGVFTLGGRHSQGTIGPTVEFDFAAVYTRELSASEILDRYENPWSVFKPRKRILYFDTSVPVRYSRPVSDAAQNQWLPSTPSQPLASMLDEQSADDADYIYADSSTSCILSMSQVLDPATSEGQVLRIRARSAYDNKLVVRLFSGATEVAVRTLEPSTEFTTYEIVLTAEECDAITSYSQLSVRLESQP